MGDWEASQPPQHHRTHHHRHHHRRRNGKSTSRSSNGGHHSKRQRLAQNSIVNPGNLYRMTQSQTGHSMVENWLEQTANQTAGQTPCSWRRSPRHQEEGPLDVALSSNRRPARVDPGWNLRHVFPITNTPTPPRPLGERGTRNSKRQRRSFSDSSFISGFENCARTPDNGHEPLSRECKDTGLDPVDTSSVVSHIDQAETFEKRPRHKTRTGKYDRRKKREHEREKTKGHDERRAKRAKKSGKRKHMASSKDVVDNFASDAVLNDRITIQPSLRPGIFDNGRLSKKQPISDLAFSKMQIQSHQKRNTQPKPLSESRLRERRRENREIEEASSFFLPSKANGGTGSSLLYADSKNQLRCLRRGQNRGVESAHGRELSTSSPQNDRKNPKYRSESLMHNDEVIEAPTLDLRNSTENRLGSSKNTTYFTWSRSSRSPQSNKKGNKTNSHKTSSWITTPGSIKKALIATGVYQNTGIRSYDGSVTKQATDATISPTETPKLRDAVVHTAVQNNSSKKHNGSIKSPRGNYMDQAMMTDDSSRSLEQRWRDILPSEWRSQHKPVSPRHIPITNEHQLPQLQGRETRESPQVTHPMDRQQIAEKTRIRALRRSISRPTLNLIGTNMSTKDTNSGGVTDCIHEAHDSQMLGSNDCASRTSRDAMPPPPLPPGGHSPDPTASSNREEVCHIQKSREENDAAPEALQVPSPAAHNHQSQYSHESVNSYNGSDSIPELSTGIERTLSSLDTVSWLPQPRTPSIDEIQRQNTISRPHMESTIYVGQLKQQPNVENLKRAPSSRTQPSESMAEFIERIERESQLPSLMYDFDHSESVGDQYDITQDLSGCSTEPLCKPQSTRTPEAEEFVEPAYNSQHHSCRLSTAVLDQEQLYTLNHGEFNADTSHRTIAPASSDISQSLEDLEDEHLEMCRFWRPNHFSQF
ncbi:hypothetical protein F5B20DRAFT_577480 [Whalleya microplaca]|nr:hypothetical protein F5B20DRAFT_577480 [Whalleya microplaca]